VKDNITNVKQGWISYLESLETSLLEHLQRQKETVVANIQEEISGKKQIERCIVKQKDAFELVEQHESDKQAFLLAQTLKNRFIRCRRKNSNFNRKSKIFKF